MSQITKYEIESVDIEYDVCMSGLSEQPFRQYSYEEIIPNVKIKFTSGDILETYLHSRKCVDVDLDTGKCDGEYHFTGNLTKNNWENKCTKCQSKSYGPIFISVAELKRQIEDRVKITPAEPGNV